MEQYSEALHQALQQRLAASSMRFLRRLYQYFRQRGGPGRELVAQELRRRQATEADADYFLQQSRSLPTDKSTGNFIPLYPSQP